MGSKGLRFVHLRLGYVINKCSKERKVPGDPTTKGKGGKTDAQAHKAICEGRFAPKNSTGEPATI